MLKFLKKLFNRNATVETKPLPGKSLQELSSELCLPELLDIYPATSKTMVCKVNDADETQSLFLAPNSAHDPKGFTVSINRQISGLSPTISLTYKENNVGRFEPCGYQLVRDPNSNMVLPGPHSIPPIRAVTNALKAYVGTESIIKNKPTPAPTFENDGTFKP